MGKATALLVALAVLAGNAARGQDIAGIEDCTKTAGLDKRTGCFQSNIDYLIKTLAKNTADAQLKLSAANTEIAALKKAVAELRTSVEQLQTAAKKTETKPEAKPNGK
jgi:phage shock protein A